MFNKVAGSNSYDFEAIVGSSSADVINGSLYMSNVISTSYKTNYTGPGSINDEIGTAACTNNNFGFCSWTAYCTQNPTQDDFFTTGGANNNAGLSNCVKFSHPKVHGYVHP